MFYRINKKGVAEVLSWTAGLIVIFCLVVVAILAYNIGGLGKRANIDVTLSNIDYSFYESLASQRVGAALFMNDFAGSENGELLGRVYDKWTGRGEGAFGEQVDAFIKMISYDYFALVIDETRVILRYKSNIKDEVGCGQWDNFGLFYLSGGENKYSSVSVLARECKHV